MHLLLSFHPSLPPAKFEEREEKVPTMEQLQRLAQLHNSDQGGSPDDTVANSLAASYTREELGKMELYMLKFFNWSVSYSTAVHFSDFFLAHGLNLDISIEGCGVDLGEAKDPILQRVQMEQYNTFFMEAALRGEHVRGEIVRGELVRGECVRGELVRGECVRGERVRRRISQYKHECEGKRR